MLYSRLKNLCTKLGTDCPPETVQISEHPDLLGRLHVGGFKLCVHDDSQLILFNSDVNPKYTVWVNSGT